MRAIRQRRFGGPDTLRVEEVPEPRPGTGALRIVVEAAGVHLLDTTLRKGGDGPFGSVALPATPGREVSGRVDAVGPGVDSSWLGKRVVAHLGDAGGGYAELAIAIAERTHVIPDELDADAAVAMIGTGSAAAAVLEATPICAGDIVMVTAAAGGVGHLLVQSVVQKGAHVIAAVGGPAKVDLIQKADLIRHLGAHSVVDYRHEEWVQHVVELLDGRNLNVVLDGVGGQIGRAALELLSPGGWLTLFGWSSGTVTPLTADDLFARGVTATAAVGARVVVRRDGMRPLERAALDAAAAGRWRPLTTRFPLEDAATAHAALENRRTVGKVVLTP
ncbi:zinc-binding dehydrogenase [Micromonospora sp. NPDC047707]|uniref:zinc-binding dehydrogenase n=1 Tax=Micromonospora sp. NPDC047707 TaxID=3154498 RepID=UPI0034533C79